MNILPPACPGSQRDASRLGISRRAKDVTPDPLIYAREHSEDVA
jgi:hypothetical protein